MAGLREKLSAFLDKSARYPFAWGEHDCGLEMADWINSACGLDAGASLRGQYASEAEAEALMPDGLEAALRAEAARLGLEEATQPQWGDVALVTVPGQEKPLGAILLPSGRWRMRTLTGFAVTRDVTVIVAWSLPCRPYSPLH